MRYRLRTLVILTAVGPPILAVVWGIVTDVEMLVTVGALLVMVSIIGVVVAVMLGVFG